MDPRDIDVIFQPNELKLGDRRLLEKKSKCLNADLFYCAVQFANRSVNSLQEWGISCYVECTIAPSEKAVSKTVPFEEETPVMHMKALPDQVKEEQLELTYSASQGPELETQGSSVSVTPLQSYIFYLKKIYD